MPLHIVVCQKFKIPWFSGIFSFLWTQGLHQFKRIQKNLIPHVGPSRLKFYSIICYVAISINNRIKLQPAWTNMRYQFFKNSFELMKSLGPKQWKNTWKPWNFKLLAHWQTLKISLVNKSLLPSFTPSIYYAMLCWFGWYGISIIWKELSFSVLHYYLYCCCWPLMAKLLLCT